MKERLKKYCPFWVFYAEPAWFWLPWCWGSRYLRGWAEPCLAQAVC